MLKEKEHQEDGSPTDELPVLSEDDVVELGGSASLTAALPDARPDDLGGRAAPPTAGNGAMRKAMSAETADVLSPGRGASAADADGDEDDLALTDSFRITVELPTAAGVAQGDYAAQLETRAAELEALLEDRDAQIASLDERLRATRAAVGRREETTRRLAEQLATTSARLDETEAKLAEAVAERRSAAERIETAARRRRELEARLAEAEATAARHAERAVQLETRLRTLELAADQREAAFAELEAELVERETRVARRERELDDASRAVRERAAALEALAEQSQPGDILSLQTELEHTREQAAALAAYVDGRRAHWLDLSERLAEQRAETRELRRELEQRAARERQTQDRASFEAARAGRLAAELEKARAQRDRKRPPALVCLTSEPRREFPLRGRTTTIGRGSRCDVHLDTHFVSRLHARLTRDGDEVHIEDLGSRNGVFVNAAKIDREALRDGDLVTIGETQFRYRG